MNLRELFTTRKSKDNFESRRIQALEAMAELSTTPLREIEERLGIDEYDFGPFKPTKRDFKSRSEYVKHTEDVEKRIGILTEDTPSQKTIFKRGLTAMTRAFRK